MKESRKVFLATRYEGPLAAHLVSQGVIAELPTDTEDPHQLQEAKLAQQKAVQDLVAEIAQADPTDAQNKNSYSEWLVRQWIASSKEDHQRFSEDTPELTKLLAQFHSVRQTPEYAQNKTNKQDINQFANLGEIRDLVVRFSQASQRYALPTLTDSVVVYQDDTYILWKVTSAQDLAALSSFPENNPPAWCTKSEHTAQSYLNSGPNYVCYKKGDPFFQLDPASEPPQFQSRHNTRMHSTKLMMTSAATVLQSALEGPDLDAQSRQDFERVFSFFAMADLNDAQTLAYLAEYVQVNGKAALNDPKFLQVERSYIYPRYTLAPRGMEPEELMDLCNRYSRTPEAIQGFFSDNQFMRELEAKLDQAVSYTQFNQNHTKLGISETEFGFCYRLSNLQAKVLHLYDQEFHFSEHLAQVQTLIALGDLQAAHDIALGLVQHVEKAFPAYNNGRGWAAIDSNFKFRDEHGYNNTYRASHCIQPWIDKMWALFTVEAFEPSIQAIEQAGPTIVETMAQYQAIRVAASNLNVKHETRLEVISRAQAAAARRLAQQLPLITKTSELKELACKIADCSSRWDMIWRRLESWCKTILKARYEQLPKSGNTGTHRSRIAPTEEFQDWDNSNHAEDPSLYTIKFVLQSSRYSTDETFGMAQTLKQDYPEVIEWVKQNSYRLRVLATGRVIGIIARYPQLRSWIEDHCPRLFQDAPYTETYYKGQTIPYLEERILEDRITIDQTVLDYIRNHRQGQRWYEWESKVVGYLHQHPGRMEELDLTNYLLDYCAQVIKGRWLKLEPLIFENPREDHSSTIFNRLQIRYTTACVADLAPRLKQWLRDSLGEDESNADNARSA